MGFRKHTLSMRENACLNKFSGICCLQMPLKFKKQAPMRTQVQHTHSGNNADAGIARSQGALIRQSEEFR